MQEQRLIREQHGVPRISETPAKTEEERQEELAKIEKYQALVDEIYAKVSFGLHYYTLSS